MPTLHPLSWVYMKGCSPESAHLHCCFESMEDNSFKSYSSYVDIIYLTLFFIVLLYLLNC